MSTSKPTPIEWPTVLLAAFIYGAWGCLTFWWAELPTAVLVVGGACLAAWQLSLAHETLHGHPTRWQTVNDAIGFPPLSLWLPYERYRHQHMRHHRSVTIADPLDDPESFYLPEGGLGAVPAPLRLLLACQGTLLGRMLIGPALGMAGFLAGEARLLRHDRCARAVWLRHGLGVACIIAWLSFACHLSLVRYGLLFVYPGYALSLLRSFAEHRAANEPDHRTAIVEGAPLLGLLFLYNNLHVVHHRWPALPWYRIPARYRSARTMLLAQNGDLLYRGYFDVARRFLLRPHDALEYPLPHRRSS